MFPDPAFNTYLHSLRCTVFWFWFWSCSEEMPHSLQSHVYFWLKVTDLFAILDPKFLTHKLCMFFPRKKTFFFCTSDTTTVLTLLTSRARTPSWRMESIIIVIESISAGELENAHTPVYHSQDPADFSRFLCRTALYIARDSVWVTRSGTPHKINQQTSPHSNTVKSTQAIAARYRSIFITRTIKGSHSILCKSQTPSILLSVVQLGKLLTTTRLSVVRLLGELPQQHNVAFTRRPR